MGGRVCVIFFIYLFFPLPDSHMILKTNPSPFANNANKIYLSYVQYI